MSEIELRKARARMNIYRSACMAANQLLIGDTHKGYPVAEAIEVLTKAGHDAAKVDMWLSIKHVRYGALFESQSGLRYIRTVERDTRRAVCIALDTGVRNQLDVNMLVRVITIKEVETDGQ